MDLSCNTNRPTMPHASASHTYLQRSHSCDEDNISFNSRCSFTFQQATNLTNSDSDNSAPISVRDMIKRYNSAATISTTKITPRLRNTQHILSSAKSSYFGVNKFGSQTNVRQYVSQLQDMESVQCKAKQLNKQAEQNCEQKCQRPRSKPFQNNDENNKNDGDNNDTINGIAKKENEIKNNNKDDNTIKSNHSKYNNGFAEEKVFIPVDYTTRTSKSPERSGNCELISVPSKLHTVCSSENFRLHSTDSLEEANLQPVETSYQSKTTIAKTSSGVRIIIDIFFDQDKKLSATDVVGSRVETDIPDSRILAEFQEQAAIVSSAESAIKNGTEKQVEST